MKYKLYSLDLSRPSDEESIVYIEVDEERAENVMKKDWRFFETKEAALSALQKIKEIL